MYRSLVLAVLAVTVGLSRADVVYTTDWYNTCYPWYNTYTTSTITRPGATTTLSLPLTTTSTSTQFTYPFFGARDNKARSETLGQADPTVGTITSTHTFFDYVPGSTPTRTLVAYEGCKYETAQVVDYTSYADPNIFVTKTAYAATATATETYTLCIPGNICIG